MRILSSFLSLTMFSMTCCILGVDVKKTVIVTITSDKGLCGGINSTSVRVSKALYKLTSGTIIYGLTTK